MRSSMCAAAFPCGGKVDHRAAWAVELCVYMFVFTFMLMLGSVEQNVDDERHEMRAVSVRELCRWWKAECFFLSLLFACSLQTFG